jgi:hypothetical protein
MDDRPSDFHRSGESTDRERLDLVGSMETLTGEADGSRQSR